jgi:type II secretory pathway component GspD/PulD (secretin)
VRRLRWLALLLVAALAVLAAPALARDVTKVYRPQHRSAAELLPLVEAAMGGEGRAVVDAQTNALVLAGPSRAVADALVVLAQQDRRLRTVVLRYESKSTRELEAAGIRVAWSAGSGGVRVGNVLWPGSGSGAVVAPEGRSVTRTSGFAGTLRLVEGGSGRLLTGTSAPITTRSVHPGFGGRGVVVHESTEIVNADTGFDASARILGDGRVEVALDPYEASLDTSGRVRRSEASTTVVLEPGKTFAVGGLDRTTSSHGIDLPTAAGAERTREERVLLLGAEIE